MLYRTFFSCLFLAACFYLFLGCKTDTVSTFNSVAQGIKDDSLLAQYIRGKGLSAVKTTKGYYYLKTVGTDSLKASKGRIAFLRYQGRLLNETVFDGNDSAATALTFQIGSGKVISGLDSAIQNFRRGEKGTVFIPSRLAYGNLTQSKVPANSCLIFDLVKLNVE